MRPRVFPAEDDVKLDASVDPNYRASMMPRVFPAEDSPRRTRRTSRSRCFNEAAGIPRGRQLDCNLRKRLGLLLQ